MALLIGWLSLLLVVYFVLAMFYVQRVTLRALKLASSQGELQNEARVVLSKNYRSRFLWLKQHQPQLPSDAQPIAARVVTADFSCWVSVVMIFTLYGLRFVVL